MYEHRKLTRFAVKRPNSPMICNFESVQGCVQFSFCPLGGVKSQTGLVPLWCLHVPVKKIGKIFLVSKLKPVIQAL